jgi:hypothetical protein
MEHLQEHKLPRIVTAKRSPLRRLIEIAVADQGRPHRVQFHRLRRIAQHPSCFGLANLRAIREGDPPTAWPPSSSVCGRWSI